MRIAPISSAYEEKLVKLSEKRSLENSTILRVMLDADGSFVTIGGWQKDGEMTLDIGCGGPGYGRILPDICPEGYRPVGIHSAPDGTAQILLKGPDQEITAAVFHRDDPEAPLVP